MSFAGKYSGDGIKEFIVYNIRKDRHPNLFESAEKALGEPMIISPENEGGEKRVVGLDRLKVLVESMGQSFPLDPETAHFKYNPNEYVYQMDQANGVLLRKDAGESMSLYFIRGRNLGNILDISNTGGSRVALVMMEPVAANGKAPETDSYVC